MSLTSQLKSEHKVILELLADAHKAGITNEGGKKKIRDAKTLIINHLKKEEVQLYPQIKNEERLAAMFRDEMAELSKGVIQFFDDWDKGMDGIEFATRLGQIIGALRTRILREETQLYPAYDRANAS